MQGLDAMAKPETTIFLLATLHAEGVTYQAIAKEIGVTYMSVFRWSKGLSTPRPILPVNTHLARLLGENRANQAVSSGLAR